MEILKTATIRETRKLDSHYKNNTQNNYKTFDPASANRIPSISRSTTAKQKIDRKNSSPPRTPEISKKIHPRQHPQRIHQRAAETRGDATVRAHLIPRNRRNRSRSGPLSHKNYSGQFTFLLNEWTPFIRRQIDRS